MTNMRQDSIWDWLWAAGQKKIHDGNIGPSRFPLGLFLLEDNASRLAVAPAPWRLRSRCSWHHTSERNCRRDRRGIVLTDRPLWSDIAISVPCNGRCRRPRHLDRRG